MFGKMNAFLSPLRGSFCSVHRDPRLRRSLN